MEELWKQIVIPHPGSQYEVSNMGRVRRVGGGYLTPMRTGTRRTGSQRSKVRLRSRPRLDFDVAHLVLTAFVAPRPPGAVAMHLNNDSSDNNVLNLRWGTPKENAVHCGRSKRANNQILSVTQMREIKTRRDRGESGVSLAREFGVSQQRVCDVYKGRACL